MAETCGADPAMPGNRHESAEVNPMRAQVRIGSGCQWLVPDERVVLL